MANAPADINMFTDHNEQVNDLQKDIEEIIRFRTKGAKLRCQANWLEGGKKCSAYYFQLEKDRFNRKTVNRLKTERGEIISDTHSITKYQAEFDQRLFRSDGTRFDPDYLTDIILPQVSEDDKYTMDAPLQTEEIHIALKQLKGGGANIQVWMV